MFRFAREVWIIRQCEVLDIEHLGKIELLQTIWHKSSISHFISACLISVAVGLPYFTLVCLKFASALKGSHGRTTGGGGVFSLVAE